MSTIYEYIQIRGIITYNQFLPVRDDDVVVIPDLEKSFPRAVWVELSSYDSPEISGDTSKRPESLQAASISLKTCGRQNYIESRQRALMFHNQCLSWICQTMCKVCSTLQTSHYFLSLFLFLKSIPDWNSEKLFSIFIIYNVFLSSSFGNFIHLFRFSNYYLDLSLGFALG